MVKKRRILKKMGSLILTFTMVLTMMVTALPVYAASGGDIKVTYDPGVTGLAATTFTVYKVGSFGTGENSGTLYLDSAYVESGANINIAVPPANATQEQKDEWQSKWLTAASTLAGHVETHADAVAGTKVGSKEVTPGTTETVTHVDANGLYLLMGEEQPAGDDRIWCPVPVLVLVLNGDTTFTYDETNLDVKMVYRPIVHKHTLIKKWVGGETVRPQKIDVDIFYGSQKIDTVTLSGANKDEWTYTWYTTELVDKKTGKVKGTYSSLDPDTNVGVDTKELKEDNNWTKEFTADSQVSWKVAEVFDPSNIWLFKFFSYEVNGTTYFIGEQVGETDEETITITNTFGTDRIKITKTLTGFAKIKDMVNAVIGYKVEGYAKVVKEDGTVSEEVVYNNSAGMVFDGDGTQSLIIYGVPQHLSKVVITEIYAGDYVLNGTPKVVTVTNPAVYTETDDDGNIITTYKQYEATYSNKFDDDPPPNLTGGIVNKYSKDQNGEYTYEHSYTYEPDPQN